MQDFAVHGVYVCACMPEYVHPTSALCMRPPGGVAVHAEVVDFGHVVAACSAPGCVAHVNQRVDWHCDAEHPEVELQEHCLLA